MLSFWVALRESPGFVQPEVEGKVKTGYWWSPSRGVKGLQTPQPNQRYYYQRSTIQLSYNPSQRNQTDRYQQFDPKPLPSPSTSNQATPPQAAFSPSLLRGGLPPASTL